MNKIKEFAIFPGQIKINNEVFFGLDYKLTDFYNELAEDNKEKDKEIERLNNIINELEKYCNNEIEEGNKALEKLSEIYNSSDTESYIKGQQAKCKHILDKLQELKGDRSNECKRDV